MFKNCARKVKILAIIEFVLMTIASFVAGVVLWVNWGDIEGFGLFALVAVGGVIVAYCSSLVLYTIGEAAEKSTGSESGKVQNVGTTNCESSNMPLEENAQTEVFLAQENGKCGLCGKENTGIVNVKIVDDLGVRYRKACSECFAKHNCKVVE